MIDLGKEQVSTFCTMESAGVFLSQENLKTRPEGVWGTSQENYSDCSRELSRTSLGHKSGLQFTTVLNEGRFLPVRFSPSKLAISKKIKKYKKSENSPQATDDSFICLLSKLFLNQPILKQELRLQKFEQIILLEIVFRISKQAELEYSNGVDPEEFLFSQIKIIQNQGSQKRNEENMKFIFKFIMKKIQEKLDPPHQEFYQHFFEEISNEKFLPLCYYFDPIQKKNPKYKSLNKEYLMNLFQSQNYRETFVTQLNPETILQDYSQNLHRKLEGIVRRFYSGESTTDQKTIHEYFNTNKQCKLPWRIQEIREAISFFLKILKKFK